MEDAAAVRAHADHLSAQLEATRGELREATSEKATAVNEAEALRRYVVQLETARGKLRATILAKTADARVDALARDFEASRLAWEVVETRIRGELREAIAASERRRGRIEELGTQFHDITGALRKDILTKGREIKALRRRVAVLQAEVATGGRRRRAEDERRRKKTGRR